MSLLRGIEWEPCLLEPKPDPELASRMRKRHGRVSSAVSYFTPCPDLSEAVANLNALLLTRVDVDRYLLDLVGMVVSQDNSCRYCYALQWAMMIATGHSEEKLRGLSQEVLAGDLSPRQRAALEFARRMSRSNPLPTREDARRLEGAGFSDEQVKELAAAVSLHVFFNRVSTIFALPPRPMEELPEKWFMRYFRPFFNLYLDWLHSRASRVWLEEDEMAGPFQPVVAALNGLPIARELRALLDKVLSDGALPARDKGLIFAVVGRALNCPHSVTEGTRIAVAGGIDAGTVEQALDHLGAPGLDETENLLLPLARESVWYQPAPIQRHARQLREQMSVEQFIECVMAASAANMVCRLGSVVVDR